MSKSLLSSHFYFDASAQFRLLPEAAQFNQFKVITFKLSIGHVDKVQSLGKRDFVDHINETDPIDGLVLIDKQYVEG